ncbi:hypothetical protein HDU81_004089 [Chytriomyces hyalinus]|nr:hypothetical protein HDU81_004089 [Chytriomyces hyalinus]
MATADQTAALAFLNGSFGILPPCLKACFTSSGVTSPVTWNAVYDSCNVQAKKDAIDACIPACNDNLGAFVLSKAHEACKAFTPALSPVAPTTAGPTKTADATTKSADATTKSADATTKSADATTKSADATTKSADATTKSADATTKSADATTKSADATTKSAEPTSSAAAETSSEAPVATSTKAEYKAPAVTKPVVATNLYSSASSIVSSIAAIFAVAAMC